MSQIVTPGKGSVPMKRILGLLILPLLNVGCVERSYIIQTNPPGALVYRDGHLLGSTPVSEKFTHYGIREYTIVKDGFEPLVVRQDFDRPWYQYPFIDFVFEHMIPYKFRDEHNFVYQLQPKVHVRTDELLDRAKHQRAIGKTIGEQPVDVPIGQPGTIPPDMVDPFLPPE